MRYHHPPLGFRASIYKLYHIHKVKIIIIVIFTFPIFVPQECQAKHICELEAKLQSHLTQSKGGDPTTRRSLESELSAKKREMTVLEMEHTREILKLEDRYTFFLHFIESCKYVILMFCFNKTYKEKSS